MIDINELKSNYASFDDAKILRLAKSESKGLKDEVIPILIHEIKRRQLNHALIAWVNAERRILSDIELLSLKQIVKSCPCTICNQNTPLKGFKFTTVIGFIIDETITNHERILCESCGKKKQMQAFFKTLCLGWWSIGGFITTPFVLIKSLIYGIQSHKNSEKYIESFIQNHIGPITLGNDRKNRIISLLVKYNQTEH